MGKLGDESAVPPLIELLLKTLLDKEREVWGDIMKALTAIGEPAVRPLIDALSSHELEVWQMVANALAQIGEPAIKPLIEAVHDSNQEVACVALGALILMGEPAIKPLIAILYENENVSRFGLTFGLHLIVMIALVNIGEPAVQPLVRALCDEKQEMPISAFIALAFAQSKAVQSLDEALRDPPLVLKMKAATEEMKKLGIEPLRAENAPVINRSRREMQFDILRTNNRQVWLQVESIIARMQKSTVDLLINALLEEEDTNVRNFAIFALCHIGELAVIPLLDAFYDENGVPQQSVAAAIAFLLKTGGPVANKVLAELKNMNSQLQMPILEGILDKLTRLDNEGLFKHLRVAQKKQKERLRRSNDYLRMDEQSRAIHSDHLPLDELLLEHLFNNKNKDVKRLTIEVLGHIADKSYVEPLIHGLNNADEQIAMRIALALGRIGDSRAIETLTLTLQNVNVAVQYSAAWALQEIRHRTQWQKSADNRPLIAVVEEERANSLAQLAKIAKEQGKYEEAQGLYRQCLDIFKQQGDQKRQVGILHNLGVKYGKELGLSHFP